MLSREPRRRSFLHPRVALAGDDRDLPETFTAVHGWSEPADTIAPTGTPPESGGHTGVLPNAAAVTVIGFMRFGTDMVIQRPRYIPTWSWARAVVDDVVAGARLARVHAVEKLAAHAGHGRRSRNC